MATPLRRDQDRRQALVELDALAALMLGLTAEQLCAMYRTQFAVLRKYEYKMAFDAEGRKIWATTRAPATARHNSRIKPSPATCPPSGRTSGTSTSSTRTTRLGRLARALHRTVHPSRPRG